jgi:YbbR domain-containing protein
MILAVLVSIGAWVFVVYNYDPMTDISYSGVPVECIGEEELADRGLAVTDVSTEGISVTLNQKRIDAGRIDEEKISVVADVSGCAAGDNTIPLTVTGPNNTSVIAVDTESVNVTVGRAKTKTMDIDVIFSEDAEEGAEPIAFDLSRMNAEASCDGDSIDKIKKIAAVLDFNEVGETVKSFTADLVALDSEGNEVPHVVIYPDEISLDACVGYTKTVSLTVPVNKKIDDSYTRTYISPEKVTIKGPKDEIDNIGTVRAYEIDIRYIYENTEIPIEYNLPEGVYVANESLGQTLNVEVAKKPAKEEKDSDS